MPHEIIREWAPAASVILTVLLVYTRLVARQARLEMKLNIMWSVLHGVVSRKLGIAIREEDEQKFFE